MQYCTAPAAALGPRQTDLLKSDKALADEHGYFWLVNAVPSKLWMRRYIVSGPNLLFALSGSVPSCDAKAKRVKYWV